MSGITRRQARILRRQIRKFYGSNFIPVLSPIAPLTIGDILINPKNINAVIDSSVFASDLLQSTEGKKNNTNIASSSSIDISVKARGEGNLSEHFQLGEAGIAVKFNASNQMFLKLYGTTIRTMSNFPKFQASILEKYSEGSLSATVYVVTSIILCDKYFLQYSGQNGGTVVFDLKAKPKQVNIQADAEFNFKWSNQVGYSVDGSNGGVLGYKVSAVRLRSPGFDEEVFSKMQMGLQEEDALNLLPTNSRKKLFKTDQLVIHDVTNQLILDMEDGLV